VIALHIAAERPPAESAGRSLVAALVDRGMVVTACTARDAAALAIDTSSEAPDVVVAVGGDGTMLEAARFATAAEADIVGINVGRVGFLAEVEVGEVDALAALLADGSYGVKERMTLVATHKGEAHVGLNDVVVEKVASQQMISVEVDVDGERFLTYRADGIIISTPTGSSAYNLSAGGPLVDPRLSAIVITPVAAYSLFSAPVILHPGVALDIKIVHDRPAGCSVDGRASLVLEPGDQVKVTSGPALRLIDVSGRSYPETLRSKLRLPEGISGIQGTDA
jgi:NAD+ kinase